MFLFKPRHHLLILTLLPLLHNALAIAIASPAPAGDPSTNTNLTTPPPPIPNFSLGAKIPFPDQDDFSLLTMLFLTCEALFSFAPYPYTSSSPSGIKISGTLKIQVEGSPELPASAFQIRHAMWALWIGAVTQLDDRDYRPGIFVMDVESGSGAGAVTRSVGSIVYRNDNRPTVPAPVANGSATAAGGEVGVGAIEPVVGAGAGADVTSQRRMFRRGGQEDGFDALLKTKQWTTAPPTTNLSLPGFPPTSPNSTTTTTTTTNFYNIQITGTSSIRISLTSVLTTVYETMVSRCSLRDREVLLAEWIYTSERSGYVFGIRPPEGMPVGESPPFEAMMGTMSNLPRALQIGRFKVEVMFDVLDGETGAVVLQGFLVVDK